ncbi:unnamed protein product [Leptidea sinapis]|uniref:Protein HGH1 homolog n=1 Tax=Leptidea sinapis TaxID=189913 RepID=A0A5E4QP15_9NEOP|nr:unnamed protein product [Leptidea sinapis]
MAKDPVDELTEFLQPEARVDLKHIALDYLLGLSGTDEGINFLVQKERVLSNIIELTEDTVEEISKNATLVLVNISANENGALEILKYKPTLKKNIIELFLGYVFDPNKKHADAVMKNMQMMRWTPFQYHYNTNQKKNNVKQISILE